MADLIYANESYEIIGACMEVHNNLGPGFLEIVYKDALEHEFSLRGIPYEREVMYEVNYKGIVLNHRFNADFVVYDRIILEAKAIRMLSNDNVAQTINYLKISENKLGLLVNFGEKKLISQRFVY